MISRKEALRFILIAAFKRTTISVSEGGIKHAGDWFSNCSFSQVDYKRYCLLFHTILLSEYEAIPLMDKNADNPLNEVSSDGTNEKHRKNVILRCEVVEGLKRYFKRYGYSLPISDDEDSRVWLAREMQNNILQVILLSKSSNTVNRTVKESEDIEEDLFDALDRIRYSTELILSLPEQTHKIQLTDNNYSPYECNYEVEIHSCAQAWSNITAYYWKIVREIECFLLFHSANEIGDKECMQYFLDWNMKDSKQDNPDMPVSSRVTTLNSKYRIKLMLTDISLDEKPIGNILCQYSTYLDGQRLLKYKGLSPYQIACKIQDEGESALFEWLCGTYGHYKSYCNQAFKVMNDLLARLFSAKIELLISGEKINNTNSKKRELKIEDCNAQIEELIINYDQLESVLRVRAFSNQQYAEQCFLIVQAIIHAYSAMLKSIGKFISKEFSLYVDVESLKHHLSLVQKLAKKTDKWLEIQKTKQEISGDLYKEPETITDLYRYRDPALFEEFKAALNLYSNALDLQI